MTCKSSYYHLKQKLVLILFTIVKFKITLLCYYVTTVKLKDSSEMNIKDGHKPELTVLGSLKKFVQFNLSFVNICVQFMKKESTFSSL